MVIAKKEERIYNSNRNKYRKIYLLHNSTKAVIGKILQIIYAVVTKNEEYKATRVFTQERLEQLKVA